jgi:phospholipid/cholesterol/gamma-HCH transport system substrate-binding protein
MVVNRSERSLAVLGTLIVIATIAFMTLFMAATSRSLAQRRAALWIELPTAEGLRKGDAVLFRGVQVGEVRQIDFAEDGDVLVRTVLTRPVPLNAAATARLVAADVFGRQTVVLEADAGSGRPLASGDTLRGLPPVSLTGRIEGMASRLERVVGDTTVDAVHGLLGQTAAAALALESALHAARETIAMQQQPLSAAVSDGAAIAANLRAATDSVALLAARNTAMSMLEQLDRITARLDSASAAMNRTAARIDGGEGSLGLLTSDPALYQRATAALAGLEELLVDLRANPKRYINVSIF